MSSSTALLDDDEKMVLIIALSVLGVLAFGGFLLVLCDPMLFRDEDDDDDDDDEFYRQPSWTMQMVQKHQEMMVEEMRVQQSREQQQYAKPPPPQPHTPPKQALPPPPQVRSQGTQTDLEQAVVSEVQSPADQMVLQTEEEMYLPAQQSRGGSSRSKSGSEEGSALQSISEQNQTTLAVHAAETASESQQSYQQHQLQVYHESQDIVEAKQQEVFHDEDIHTEPSVSNQQVARNDMLTIYEAPEASETSRAETKMEKDHSKDESEVEIAPYTPRQSLVSLPEEAKNFQGVGEEDPLSPLTPHHQGSFSTQSSQTDPGVRHPSTPPSSPPAPPKPTAVVAPMKIQTLIPRYSHKAERQRFIILNVLILVIISSIVSVLVIRFYL